MEQCNATFMRQSVLGNIPVFSQPTALSEYDPVTISYYTQHVLPTVWPSIVGVALFGILFVGFVVWRCARWCRCCGKGRKGSSAHSRRDTRPLPFTVKDGGYVPYDLYGDASKSMVSLRAHAGGVPEDGRIPGKTVTLVGVFVMLLGVIGSSIYGMVVTNHQYVDQAVDVIESGTGYVQNVLGDFQQAISAGKQLDSSLASIESSLQGNQVQALNVESDLQCIAPYVDQLPSQLGGTVDSVTSSAVPVLNGLKSDLQAGLDLVVGIPEDSNSVVDRLISFPSSMEPFAGDLTAASEVAKEIQSTSTPAGAALVGALQEDIAKLLVSWDAQVEILSRVDEDIGAVTTAVEDLAASLPQNVDAAKALLASQEVADLQSVYQKQRKAYNAAQGCISNLLNEADAVLLRRSDVSGEVKEYIAVLKAANEDLRSLFVDERQFDDIIASLDGDLDEVKPLVDDLVRFGEDLKNSPEYEQLDRTRRTIQSSRDIMVQTKPELEKLLDQIRAFEAIPSSNVEDRASAYQNIVLLAQPLGTSASLAAQGIQALISDLKPLLNEAQIIRDQAASANLESYLSEVNQLLQGLDNGKIQSVATAYDDAIAKLPDPPSQAIDSIRGYIDTAVGDISASISSVRSDVQQAIVSAQDGVDTVTVEVVDRINEYVDKYEPQAQEYNTYRSAIMYVLFSLSIAFSITTFINGAIVWPALHSLSIFLLLCLMIINFCLVTAHTAGIKVGSDTCENLEPFILDQVDDPGASSVLQYYFGDGTNGSVVSIAKDAFNLDIPDIIRTVNETKAQVLADIEGVSLSDNLEKQVNTALAQADMIVNSINSAVAKLEYAAVTSGPYQEVRGFVCCDTIDNIGNIWLAMILTGGFAFLLSVFAMILVFKFDKYCTLKKWFERYKRQ
jgi:hypothetical protein